jgi:DNA polymerase-3 subunit alpha
MKTDPMLKKYCEEHPDIAKAAQKLINRNRGTGIHAGGLIVSSIPLTDLVPLIKRKDSPQASAWVEGLHGQDLQPVGLVKFDLLVISNLLQIAKCCKLIKDRKGIDKICAFPGQGNWSNIDEYRNDLKSLEMANEGDLKCIFQFDSPGIRSLAKAGGVTRFEDLVAYSSLYRPGPLNCLQKDVKVNTNLGYKKIKDLKPGLDKIAYLSKKKKIKYTEKFILIKTGYKKLLKIKTKSGKVILCSNEHKILTDKDEFIEAEKLSVGQKIAKKLK